MGQKDITMKMFMNHNEIFADIINNTIFRGCKIVRAEELYITSPETQYKGNKKYHNQYQDLTRLWIVDGEILAEFSLENQVKARRMEPVKTIGYDGASFDAQLTSGWGIDADDTGDPEDVYPCITIVLYYGLTPWRASGKLSGLMKRKYEDYLKQFTPETKLNLWQLAFLSEEEVNGFTSDFWILVDYLTQMHRNNTYVPGNVPMQYPEELFAMMNAVTNTDWRSEAIDRMMKEGKEITMVSAYAEITEKAKNEGIHEGLTAGESRGVEKNRKDNALRMLKGGKLSLQDISEYTGLSMAEVEDLRDAM